MVVGPFVNTPPCWRVAPPQHTNPPIQLKTVLGGMVSHRVSIDDTKFHFTKYRHTFQLGATRQYNLSKEHTELGVSGRLVSSRGPWQDL